jgi:hypothetical protein
MTFPKGYSFMKVETSQGPEVHVSQFGELVRVVPCDSRGESSKNCMRLARNYANDLIHKIEST